MGEKIINFSDAVRMLRDRSEEQRVSFDCFFEQPSEAEKIVPLARRIALKNVLTSTLPAEGSASRLTFHTPGTAFHVIAVNRPFSQQATNVMCEIIKDVYSHVSKLSSAILDPELADTPEGKSLLGITSEIGIPVFNIQLAPYSDEVARTAGIKPSEAKLTAIHTDFLDLSCYAGKEEALLQYLMEKYGYKRETVKTKLGEILYDRMHKDPVKAEKDRLRNLSLLTDVANFLSLGHLESKEEQLKGKVLVLTKIEHSCIFDPEFIPNSRLLLPDTYPRQDTPWTTSPITK